MRGALDIGMFQINRFDDPRWVFAQLLRRQALFFDQTANRRRTDFQRSCSFVQSDLSTLGALALSVGRDGVLVAQTANADMDPTIAPPRRLTGAVEIRGDGAVGLRPRDVALMVSPPSRLQATTTTDAPLADGTVKDLHLRSQVRGIVTLVHPAAERATWRQLLAWLSSRTDGASSSPAPPISFRSSRWLTESSASRPPSIASIASIS